MKTIIRVLVLMLFTTAIAAANPVEIGMPEAKLLELKGAPQSKASIGNKGIYRWPDLEVTLIDGKVAQFQHRNPMVERRDARERAAAENRKKAEAKADARQAQADARRAESQTKRAAAEAEYAQDQRLVRMTFLQGQIRDLERMLDEDAKRTSIGKGREPMSAEARALLNSRLENARRELAGLR